MSVTVEKLNIEQASLGEGPHWDEETQTLYYVDIVGQTINKYDPLTKVHTKANIGKNVSIIIPVKGQENQFVITYGREIILISWDGQNDKIEILKKLYEVDQGTDNVFNDGKVDPSGRLWTGTIGKAPSDLSHIPQKKGSLYSFKNGQITKYKSGIGISNGLAFDTKLNKLYYVDSYSGTVDQYDFDIDQGSISNEKAVYTLFEQYDPNNENLGLFDGMAIDTDGNIWVACFNSSKVLKIDPRKPETIANEIKIPGKQVTSVAFGGRNLDELYVTTGRFPIKGVTPSSPEDGALYRVTGVNVKGFPGEKIVLSTLVGN